MLAGRLGLPLAITVAYVLLASVWIWVTQWLLGRLGGAHWEISTTGLIFGEIFVLVTGVLLYVLVDRLTASRPGAVDFGHGHPSAARFWLIAMLLALVAIAVIQIFIAAVAARQYAPILLEKAQRETSNLAAIRAIEIDNWVEERDQRVRAFRERTDWLREWIERVDEGEEDGFTDELLTAGMERQFDALVLLDPDRAVRLRSAAPRLNLPDMEHFDRAAVTTDIQIITRFTRGRGGVDVFWILPLFVDRAEVSRGPWSLVFWTRLNAASLIDDTEQGFRVRSEAGLRTLLIDLPDSGDRGSAFWPMLTLDPVGESAVVGETPSAIVSRLRQGLSGALASEPAARENTPDGTDEISAEGFGEGVTRIEGTDRVYATVQLGRLNAQILVLQDRRDVLAPVEQLEKWLGLTAILSTIGMLAALVFLWRYLRARYRQGNLDVLRERDFWHQAWLDMPALGLIELDPRRLYVITANRQAADWLGASRDHLVGQPLFQLFEPTDPASPVAGHPEAALPGYFARGAVDHISLEGRMIAAPEHGPMLLDLRVLRDEAGDPERMIGMLRPYRSGDGRALCAALDHLAARCAVLPAEARRSWHDRLADEPESPFLAVIPLVVDTECVHVHDDLVARLAELLPGALRLHQALLRPLADEVGRVLVSREGRWVQSHGDSGLASNQEAAAAALQPGVINAVGHSVLVLPDGAADGEGQVGVRLYITRDRCEITPDVLVAIERLHHICTIFDRGV
ncbi:PAS domain-containing protein [Guyparkeria sp.]|uniref:PAS domain-containing protein n=1 Tax=Guyparkeria sp. TaxID=2035736 RepID=UPI003970D489